MKIATFITSLLATAVAASAPDHSISPRDKSFGLSGTVLQVSAYHNVRESAKQSLGMYMENHPTFSQDCTANDICRSVCGSIVQTEVDRILTSDFHRIPPDTKFQPDEYWEHVSRAMTEAGRNAYVRIAAIQDDFEKHSSTSKLVKRRWLNATTNAFGIPGKAPDSLVLASFESEMNRKSFVEHAHRCNNAGKHGADRNRQSKGTQSRNLTADHFLQSALRHNICSGDDYLCHNINATTAKTVDLQSAGLADGCLKERSWPQAVLLAVERGTNVAKVWDLREKEKRDAPEHAEDRIAEVKERNDRSRRAAQELEQSKVYRLTVFHEGDGAMSHPFVVLASGKDDPFQDLGYRCFHPVINNKVNQDVTFHRQPRDLMAVGSRENQAFMVAHPFGKQAKKNQKREADRAEVSSLASSYTTTSRHTQSPIPGPAQDNWKPTPTNGKPTMTMQNQPGRTADNANTDEGEATGDTDEGFETNLEGAADPERLPSDDSSPANSDQSSASSETSDEQESVPVNTDEGQAGGQGQSVDSSGSSESSNLDDAQPEVSNGESPLSPEEKGPARDGPSQWQLPDESRLLGPNAGSSEPLAAADLSSSSNSGSIFNNPYGDQAPRLPMVAQNANGEVLLNPLNRPVVTDYNFGQVEGEVALAGATSFKAVPVDHDGGKMALGRVLSRAGGEVQAQYRLAFNPSEGSPQSTFDSLGRGVDAEAGDNAVERLGTAHESAGESASSAAESSAVEGEAVAEGASAAEGAVAGHDYTLMNVPGQERPVGSIVPDWIIKGFQADARAAAAAQLAAGAAAAQVAGEITAGVRIASALLVDFTYVMMFVSIPMAFIGEKANKRAERQIAMWDDKATHASELYAPFENVITNPDFDSTRDGGHLTSNATGSNTPAMDRTVQKCNLGPRIPGYVPRKVEGSTCPQYIPAECTDEWFYELGKDLPADIRNPIHCHTGDLEGHQLMVEMGCYPVLSGEECHEVLIEPVVRAVKMRHDLDEKIAAESKKKVDKFVAEKMKAKGEDYKDQEEEDGFTSEFNIIPEDDPGLQAAGAGQKDGKKELSKGKTH